MRYQLKLFSYLVGKILSEKVGNFWKFRRQQQQRHQLSRSDVDKVICIKTKKVFRVLQFPTKYFFAFLSFVLSATSQIEKLGPALTSCERPSAYFSKTWERTFGHDVDSQAHFPSFVTIRSDSKVLHDSRGIRTHGLKIPKTNNIVLGYL